MLPDKCSCCSNPFKFKKRGIYNNRKFIMRFKILSLANAAKIQNYFPGVSLTNESYACGPCRNIIRRKLRESASHSKIDKYNGISENTTAVDHMDIPVPSSSRNGSMDHESPNTQEEPMETVDKEDSTAIVDSTPATISRPRYLTTRKKSFKIPQSSFKGISKSKPRRKPHKSKMHEYLDRSRWGQLISSICETESGKDAFQNVLSRFVKNEIKRTLKSNVAMEQFRLIGLLKQSDIETFTWGKAVEEAKEAAPVLYNTIVSAFPKQTIKTDQEKREMRIGNIFSTIMFSQKSKTFKRTQVIMSVEAWPKHCRDKILVALSKMGITMSICSARRYVKHLGISTDGNDTDIVENGEDEENEHEESEEGEESDDEQEQSDANEESDDEQEKSDSEHAQEKRDENEESYNEQENSDENEESEHEQNQDEESEEQENAQEQGEENKASENEQKETEGSMIEPLDFNGYASLYDLNGYASLTDHNYFANIRTDDELCANYDDTSALTQISWLNTSVKSEEEFELNESTQQQCVMNVNYLYDSNTRSPQQSIMIISPLEENESNTRSLQLSVINVSPPAEYAPNTKSPQQSITNISSLKEYAQNARSARQSITNVSPLKQSVTNISPLEKYSSNTKSPQQSVSNISTLEEYASHTKSPQQTVTNISPLEYFNSNTKFPQQNVTNLSPLGEYASNTRYLHQSVTNICHLEEYNSNARSPLERFANISPLKKNTMITKSKKLGVTNKGPLEEYTQHARSTLQSFTNVSPLKEYTMNTKSPQHTVTNTSHLEEYSSNTRSPKQNFTNISPLEDYASNTEYLHQSVTNKSPFEEYNSNAKSPLQRVTKISPLKEYAMNTKSPKQSVTNIRPLEEYSPNTKYPQSFEKGESSTQPLEMCTGITNVWTLHNNDKHTRQLNEYDSYIRSQRECDLNIRPLITLKRSRPNTKSVELCDTYIKRHKTSPQNTKTDELCDTNIKTHKKVRQNKKTDEICDTNIKAHKKSRQNTKTDELCDTNIKTHEKSRQSTRTDELYDTNIKSHTKSRQRIQGDSGTRILTLQDNDINKKDLEELRTISARI